MSLFHEPSIRVTNDVYESRLVEEGGAICAVARRDIDRGEELTHPYTQVCMFLCMYICMYVCMYIFIGKVAFICLRVSVNLVYKFQGKPGTTTVKHDFNPNGLKFHRGSP